MGTIRTRREENYAHLKPSHPLLSPSPPAPNPSQHQGDAGWHHRLDGRASE